MCSFLLYLDGGNTRSKDAVKFLIHGRGNKWYALGIIPEGLAARMEYVAGRVYKCLCQGISRKRKRNNTFN